MQKPANTRAPRARARQQGVIVFIALIVLVAMTLAALSLIRSTDTGNVIAGNLAFKQATANAADSAMEAVYRQLLTADGLGTGALNNDNAFPGYHSSSPGQPEPNYSNPAWFQANGACAVAGCAPDGNGNVTYYVAHRMCTEPNTAYNGSLSGVPNTCATLVPIGGASDGGSMNVGSHDFQPNPQLYYRVTALIVGPRNSQAVVQSMVVLSN